MEETGANRDAGETASLPPPVMHELPEPGERYVPVNWKFFGLREEPFSLSPDPPFFFFGHRQEADLSQLVFGIGQRRGLMLVTGEAGAGKSIFARALLDQFDDDVRGFLFSADGIGDRDLIELVCRERGYEEADPERLRAELQDEHRNRKNTVIFIDEAENLTVRQLEQVRTLGGYRVGEEKSVQVILLADPEILEMLLDPALGKLSKEITVRVALRPFTVKETEDYVRHRLGVAAGGNPPEPFTPSARRALQRWSRGNPRLINLLGDRAMHKAYAAENRIVDRQTLRRARKDLGLEPSALRPAFFAAGSMAAAAALLWAGMGWIPLPGRAAPEVLEEPLALEASGVTVAAPGPPPRAVPTADAEAPAPGAAPRAALTGVKPDSIVRVTSAAESLNGSLATLFHIWGMGDLAGECSTWKVVNFNPSLLGIFFRETGIFQQYGIELHPLSVDMPFLHAAGLPVLFTYRRGQGAADRYAVLAGFEEQVAVIFDPLEGRVEIPLAEWEERAAGPVYSLYLGSRGFVPLAPGDKGDDVSLLQEELREAGVYQGEADGVYGGGTLRAVRSLQNRYGLQADGVAGLRTRLVLMKESGRFSPAS